MRAGVVGQVALPVACGDHVDCPPGDGGGGGGEEEEGDEDEEGGFFHGSGIGFRFRLRLRLRLRFRLRLRIRMRIRFTFWVQVLGSGFVCCFGFGDSFRLLVVGGLLALAQSVLIRVLSSWAIESQSCVCASVFQLPDACTFGAALQNRPNHLLHINSHADFLRPEQAGQRFASISFSMRLLLQKLRMDSSRLSLI